jgi:hypothetical protein
MQCCGCGAVARDMTPGDLDGIRIDCSHCGIYEVSGTVLNRFLRMTLLQRAEALGRAKRLAHPGVMPLVDARCV